MAIHERVTTYPCVVEYFVSLLYNSSLSIVTRFIAGMWGFSYVVNDRRSSAPIPYGFYNSCAALIRTRNEVLGNQVLSTSVFPVSEPGTVSVPNH